MNRVVDKLGLPNVHPSSLGSMVSAQVLKDTSLIEVRVQNTDKVLAARIANSMASEFVQFVSETNQERMARSLKFLAEQEAMLKKQLAAAYAELGRVQARPDNLATISREIESQNQIVVGLRGDLAKTRMEVAMAEASLREIDRQLAVTAAYTVEPADGSPSVRNPKHQELETARAQKSTDLADSQAKSAALQQEIGNLETSSAALDAKLVAAQNNEAVAKADVARLESTLNLLSSKIVEAQMAHSLNLGETTIDVISPALEPVVPVKPRKMVNMAVAGVLGAFVSVLLVFVLEYMDNTVKTPDDVARYLNLGTLGAIPMAESRQKRKK
jgi:capsular polysaccharide biosynthesis protein